MGKNALLMALDPGSLSVGYAIFGDSKGFLLDYGCLVENRETVWERRTYLIAKKVQKLITYFSPKQLVIEQPQIFATHAGSHTDSVIKLSVSVGTFYYVGVYNDVKTALIPVNKWKGQLTKSLVKWRIQEYYNNEFKWVVEKDAWDAIGLGLYHLKLGMFK